MSVTKPPILRHNSRGMTEVELIRKIQELKKIKPRKDWVVLAKREILGQPPTTFREFSWLSIFSPKKWWGVFPYQYRLVLASLIFLGILITGALSFAQNALPGDLLYSLKRITEKSQAVFVSEEEKPKAQLELANKRLEELTKIAEQNQTQRLAPAINEFQASVSQVAKDLKKPKKLTKEIIDQTKKLEENKEKVEALGVVVGETEELENALSQLVEREIKDLEKRTLTEEQQEILEKTKEDFEAGNYSEALIKILNLSQ